MQVLESPGKSWKSVKSCKKIFFQKNFLQYYFWIYISLRVCCFNYCALGDLEKICLSSGEVLDKAWKVVSKRGHEPCTENTRRELPKLLSTGQMKKATKPRRKASSQVSRLHKESCFCDVHTHKKILNRQREFARSILSWEDACRVK